MPSRDLETRVLGTLWIATVLAPLTFALIAATVFVLALNTPTQPTQPRVVCPSVAESVDATVAALAQATAETHATRDAAWTDRAATQDAERTP